MILRIGEKNMDKIVLISGGFDPIHSGHIHLINEASKHGGVIVLLNSDEWLRKKNIVYSPDYLVNSGGVIAIASEINKTQNLLTKQLEKIGDRLLPVLEESKKSGESTDLVASRIAWERINS